VRDTPPFPALLTLFFFLFPLQQPNTITIFQNCPEANLETPQATMTMMMKRQASGDVTAVDKEDTAWSHRTKSRADGVLEMLRPVCLPITQNNMRGAEMFVS
jgi:hypothetical protein